MFFLFGYIFDIYSACWQTKVDPARDVIYVNGNRLPKKLPSKVYLALNKPKGCVYPFLFIINTGGVWDFDCYVCESS